ncbi:MAG: glycosyltransferase family 4 protein [Acidobacteriota bacterium]|nr:glycosyltransferase family 4 protein [Acidobacteriota bacterium]
MKIAFVIHRYGADIVGGSETHCRRIAEQLAARHSVEVLTTTASDYVTWKEGYKEGVETINGVTVRRFRVRSRRNLVRFKEISDLCFHGQAHTAEDEKAWVRANGPDSPDLARYVRENKAGYDAFVIYSYRYATAWDTLPEVADKAILVPTAEEDPAVHLTIFRDFFALPAGILFLTPEEQDLVGRAALGSLPPSAVIGFAVDVPAELDPEGFKKRRGLDRPYVLYVGRIDRNKGCELLFRYFQEYLKRKTHDVDLVLGGSAALSIPDHPRIKYLGFLTDREKFEAIFASELLVMPSPYESLCIVVLEAWKAGRVTLVNGQCKVLRGQSRRSRGGLYFDSFAEFCEAMDFLLDHPAVGAALGRAGRAWIQANFEWVHLTAKIEDMIARTIAARAK